MFRGAALLSFCLIATVRGQQVGTLQTETHPRISVATCQAGGSCTSQNLPVVLDSNWRWLHRTSNFTNCYTGNEWDASACPNNQACAQNCALDGADYSGTYGITANGNALRLNFITNGQQKNIGSRVYLMADDDSYRMFNMKNQELAFDVDVSQLPCGLNGAVYFSQMDADGGASRFPTNRAGARYGTGYCDSQCPRDIKFINGLANVEGWEGSDNDVNAGTGNFGTCCAEMDLWEANSQAAAVTPHPCTVDQQTRCSGADCGSSTGDRYSGVCDPDGCDFNSFRMGDQSFYGPGMTVDTNQKITVVTQFLTNNNQSSGTLSEIRRVYVQNGQVIQNSASTIQGVSGNSLTDSFCSAQKTAFGDRNSFAEHGGMAQMGRAFDEGMVLVLSIWDDHAVNMLWLDSDYPTTADPSQPGVSRGPCPTSSGRPEDVENSAANAFVVYSNIKVGPIGSTFSANGSPAPAPAPGGGGGAPGGGAPGGTVPRWGQCGGQGYSGPTSCEAGTTCTVLNPFYSQCL